MVFQEIYFVLSIAALSLFFSSGKVRFVSSAEVSGNFILQVKHVPGYVMPTTHDDPYHTKAFFSSSVELFLTQSLQKDANKNSKFSLLSIYKVEMHNQVVGQKLDTINETIQEESNLRPLYVNMTISGEYTPLRKQKDSIDSSEYQQVLLQLFQEYGGNLATALKDLVNIPYFSHVTNVNAIPSSVLESQAKMTLDAIEVKEQKSREQKLTASIAFLSIGGFGMLLLSIVAAKVISARVRYNQVVAEEAKNDLDRQHNIFSATSGRIPPSNAFDYTNKQSYPYGYNIPSSDVSIAYSNRQANKMPSSLFQDPVTSSNYFTRSEEFSMSDGLMYKRSDADAGGMKQDIDNMTRSSTSTSTSSKRSASSIYSKLRAENYDGVKRHCFAPPGKLGVAIEDGPPGVGPVVHKIKTGSSLEGILKSGDRIVAIDDTDTRELSAADVTAWMVEKMECRRKISYMTLKQGTLV